MHRASRTLVPLLAAVSLIAPSAQAQCPLPPAIVNSTSSIAGDLTIAMGISANQVAVGDDVDFHLSVYNGGSASVVIPNPGQVSAIHSWSVLPPQCETYYEPDGCLSATPFFWPQGVFFFGQPTSVAPGQCRTYTTHWDGAHWGNPNLPVIPGTYRVVGGFLVGGEAVTSQGAPLEALVVPLEITAAVPVVSDSWSGIKARFE